MKTLFCLLALILISEGAMAYGDPQMPLQTTGPTCAGLNASTVDLLEKPTSDQAQAAQPTDVKTADTAKRSKTQ